MIRFLSVACVLLGLGCLYFAWTAVDTAHRERDRAEAAEAEARACEIAARPAHVAQSPNPLEQPPIPVPAERTAQSRDADPTSHLQAIDERLAQLEVAVGALQAQPTDQPSVNALDTPESIAKAFRAISNVPEERARRVQLLERFLDMFPNDPGAADMLEKLIAEHLYSNRSLALTALDKYGARIVNDISALDGLRANVLIQNRRFDEGRSYYERVLRAASDEPARADASFKFAYSYMQEGRLDEAKAQFENLIARYEHVTSPYLTSTIQGAKNQLVLIEQYKAKKKD